MSVLIKGIDMPKEPWDCPCHNGETGQCKVIHIGCYDCIPKCCPLVEVPTPHGRLIDADALYYQFEYADYDFEETLEYAPTIIEADKESEE